MANGFLLVDKPVGVRSTDCVARVKRFFSEFDGTERVGHAGTLDSTASGLLVVLLGAATRLSDYVMKLPKVYEATVSLGVSTDTCDASGRAVFSGDVSRADDAEVDRVLFSFLGARMQFPPEISALKLNGRTSHKAARSGEILPLAARRIAVTSVTLNSPVRDGAVKISVTCGKGTYIRAIARDMGAALGCGAHVSELRRISAGPFHISGAVGIHCLKNESALIPLSESEKFFGCYHRIMLTEDAERRLWDGLCVPMAEAGRYVPGTLPLESGLCVHGAGMIGFTENAKNGGVLKPLTNIKLI